VARPTEVGKPYKANVGIEDSKTQRAIPAKQLAEKCIG